MKAWCRAALLGVCALLLPSGAHAAADQVEAPAVASDPLFPGPGKASVALSTGVPFWVMGELSLGIGDHFAIGALAGATPLVSGFGLRPRGELPLSDDWSLLGMASGLYYPPGGSTREWWLVRPSVLLERHLGRANVALGGGMVAAATNDKLFGTHDGRAQVTSPYPGGAPARFDSGAWLTANAVASLRLSRATHLFLDGAVVFDTDFRLATDDWVGGPPVIAFLGVETAL